MWAQRTGVAFPGQGKCLETAHGLSLLPLFFCSTRALFLWAALLVGEGAKKVALALIQDLSSRCIDRGLNGH